MAKMITVNMNFRNNSIYSQIQTLIIHLLKIIKIVKKIVLIHNLQ